MKRAFIVVFTTVFLLGLAGKVKATLIELTPVVDQSAWKHNSDPWELRPEGETLLAVSRFANVGVEEARSALEFDISAIPNLPITQVTLTLTKVELMDEMIQIDGYIGDGTITAPDFDQSGFLAQHDPEFGLNVIDLGQEGIDFIEDLVLGNEMHAGILLTEIGFSSNLFLSREATPGEGQVIPTLGVEVVPEPATMLLLGTGLVGLVGLRKKLKK